MRMRLDRVALLACLILPHALILSADGLTPAPILAQTGAPPSSDQEAVPDRQVDQAPARSLASGDKTEERAAAAGGVRTAMIDWFLRGGIFMWPLLACSIVGVGLTMERWFTLSRARINTRRFMDRLLGALRDHGVDGALEICTRTRGPIAAILHSGLMRADKGPDSVAKAIESAGVIEMSFLQRSLTWLASITVIAPLLGFLGTVSGMINAFDAIAAADQVSPRVVASGISEALITTEAGLCIAIPIQLAHNWFVTQIDKFITEMEEASVEVVDTLVDLEHQRAVPRVRA
jgi:biopolymer transport protein ExbB